jgi:hypothetical protein
MWAVEYIDILKIPETGEAAASASLSIQSEQVELANSDAVRPRSNRLQLLPAHIHLSAPPAASDDLDAVTPDLGKHTADEPLPCSCSADH